MKRREFLKTTAASAVAAGTGMTVAGMLGCSSDSSTSDQDSDHSGHDHVHTDECRTFASVEDAIKSPPETLLYVPVIYAGKGNSKPDLLATIDVDPSSKNFGKVISRLKMPNANDELHHFGWNTCSSCHGEEGKHRRYIVLPGLSSSRIHIVDTIDPTKPKLHKVIEPAEVKKAGLTSPHTVHCLADGTIMISCLGNAEGEGPGGFLTLNSDFEITGRWEKDATGMMFNYDYWYQPRHNVMVSSEWAAPNTVSQGFKVEHVQAGKYGQRIHFWDWEKHTLEQTIDLGSNGLIPLEVRFHHNPENAHGFVGAALSSTMWHFHKDGDKWAADSVIAVDAVDGVEGWNMPVPGLITDLVLSMDDQWLYFANWLHGDIRQYDVSDPAKPVLKSQLWLGGLIGHEPDFKGPKGKLGGGPQMIQLSLDGKRLYVTNSLYGPWDDQFYPDMRKEGSYLLQIDCDDSEGGMKVNDKFFVDFGAEPDGPARAHEMRFPNGDCTSDIFV